MMGYKTIHERKFEAKAGCLNPPQIERWIINAGWVFESRDDTFAFYVKDWTVVTPPQRNTRWWKEGTELTTQLAIPQRVEFRDYERRVVEVLTALEMCLLYSREEILREMQGC